MPLFEYKCTNCKIVYEKIVNSRYDDYGLDVTVHPRCPNCDYPGRRQMSVSSFKINGFSEKNGYSSKNA